MSRREAVIATVCFNMAAVMLAALLLGASGQASLAAAGVMGVPSFRVLGGEQP